MNLIEHLQNQQKWSQINIGPGTLVPEILDHIRKELREIEQAPGDVEEWIDVVLLALDGAWRQGYSPEQIANALAAKQAVNERRQWPDWRTNIPGKAIEHIRG